MHMLTRIFDDKSMKVRNEVIRHSGNDLAMTKDTKGTKKKIVRRLHEILNQVDTWNLVRVQQIDSNEAYQWANHRGDCSRLPAISCTRLRSLFIINAKSPIVGIHSTRGVIVRLVSAFA